MILGPIVCVALAILWLNFIFSLKHPNPVTNMDGMNRWGGYVGAVMVGILVGGIGGPFITISEKPLRPLAITAGTFLSILLLFSLV